MQGETFVRILVVVWGKTCAWKRKAVIVDRIKAVLVTRDRAHVPGRTCTFW